MAKKVAVASITNAGTKLNVELVEKLKQEGYECTGYATPRLAEEFGIESIGEDSTAWTGENWEETDLFVFISATGRVVRAIAPWVDKESDTAVLVMDEVGEYVIPMISKNMGAANAYAGVVAKRMGAVPILTSLGYATAGKFSCEQFVADNGLETSNKKLMRQITAAILGGHKVGLYSEYEIVGMIPEVLTICSTVKELAACYFGISVTDKETELEGINKSSVLQLVPRNIVVGLDYQSNMSWAHLREQIVDVLQSKSIGNKKIEKIVSSESRKEDSGINALAKRLEVPYVTYTAEELRTVEPVTKPNLFTRRATFDKQDNIDMVCERAAILGSGNGTLFFPRMRNEGVEIAFASRNWKLVFKDAEV